MTVHETATCANLHMCDAYSGPTRLVPVLVASTGDEVFLKSVKPLAKREFEDLLGFGCGQFETNRVIRLNQDVLCWW